MNIEEQLTNLKNDYQSTQLPSYLIYDGWPKLRLQLAGRKTGFFPAYFKKALIFAVLLLLVLVTTAKVSQAAKPGDKLYPVKLATENIESLVTGRQTNKIENRAQEIINISKSSDNNLDAAVKRYEDAVDASKNNTSDKNKQELKNTLRDQEEKLRETQSRDREDQELIDKAAEKTREVRGDIKGEKDNDSNSQNQQEEKSDNDNDEGDNQNSNHSSDD